MDIKSLKPIGVEHEWQVPLCCPIDIEDYTNVITDFTQVYKLSGHKVLVGGQLQCIPTFDWSRGKGVLIKLLDDINYLLTIKMFGDSRELQEQITQIDKRYFFQGISFANGRNLNLRAAKHVDDIDVGTLSTIYPSKRGVINASLVKTLIQKS